MPTITQKPQLQTLATPAHQVPNLPKAPTILTPPETAPEPPAAQNPLHSVQGEQILLNSKNPPLTFTLRFQHNREQIQNNCQ